MILKEKEKHNIIEEKGSDKYDIIINIGMIGCHSVGKTSLSASYESQKPVPEIPYVPTISLDFFHRIIEKNGKLVKVKIWDTSGQERFNSITSGYLRGLHGCFIVYDVSDRDSFDKLDTWIQFYNDFNKYKERIMIILGNKVDKQNREVTKDEGIKYSKRKGLSIFETSTVSMINVNEAFEEMINKILLSQDDKSFAQKKEIICIGERDLPLPWFKRCC